MILTNEQISAVLTAAFFGGVAELQERVKPSLRFAHYTSSETALRIIRGEGTDRALWLRNAAEMNDFSEVEFGQSCLANLLRRREFIDRIKKICIAMNFDISSAVFGPMQDERRRIKHDTFLLSLSEHDEDEKMGCLSMWRAYGGRENVCLILNIDAFINQQSAYDADITAVDYGGQDGFDRRFIKILDSVEKNIDNLKIIDKSLIASNWKVVLDDLVLSTKHPGFKEEREWRVIHRRKASHEIPAPPHKIVVVGGVAQIVHYLPMRNVPEMGVHKASLDEILARLIIGPTANPAIVMDAFVEALGEAGVSNPQERVVACNIPLRR